MKPLIAVVGDRHLGRRSRNWRLATLLGKRLINEGYRIVSGGLGDLPVALAAGARQSPLYQEGALIAILPTFNPSDAGNAADIVIAAGIDYARNMLVANSDAVVALGGGAGTLSEIALAWSLKRLILAYEVPGWSGKLAESRVDDRIRYPAIKEDCVYPVRDDTEVAETLKRLLPLYKRRHRGATAN